jgi:thiol-disulfide isomerase/thioredoxin
MGLPQCRFVKWVPVIVVGAVVAMLLGSATARSASRGNSSEDPAQPPKAKPGTSSDKDGLAGESITIRLEPRNGVMDMVNYYRPMRIVLSDEPPETVKAEPKYQSEKPLYGTLQIGEFTDKPVTIVVDEPENGEPRIYVDRNNDGDLTNDGAGQWTRTSGPTLFLSGVAIDVRYQTGMIPYTFEFYRFKDQLRDAVLYYRNSGREGQLSSGGKSYKIAVLDDNADARFDDIGNDTIIIDLNGDGKLVGSSDSAEHHRLAEPFNIHGQVWQVVSFSADGTRLVVRHSAAKVEMKPYLDPGYPAPKFAGKGLDDQEIRLDDNPDETYTLLDFWASWCVPCRLEYPYLRRVHARYRGHGLRVIGINLDEKRDAAVDAASDELLEYPHVFDGGGWKNAVAVLYRVHGIPQTYLLDKDGKIVAKGLRGEALEKRLQELLGEGDSDAAAAIDAKAAERPAKPDATLKK